MHKKDIKIGRVYRGSTCLLREVIDIYREPHIGKVVKWRSANERETVNFIDTLEEFAVWALAREAQ